MLQEDYQVDLDAFCGPLDLLLFLIRRAEVDVQDIPIARITDQYLAFLRQLDDIDIDIAGDFLVMAAMLVEIKSRTLVPPETRPRPAQEANQVRAREASEAVGETPTRTGQRLAAAVAEREDAAGPFGLANSSCHVGQVVVGELADGLAVDGQSLQRLSLHLSSFRFGVLRVRSIGADRS